MATEPDGGSWLDGKLDPEELRSALNFPDRQAEEAVQHRFRLKSRRIAPAPRAIRVPTGNDPMTHAIQALSARIDEMAAAQAEMAAVVHDLIETWPVGAAAETPVDTIVAVLQEVASREDRSAMIAAALPGVIARLTALDSRIESVTTTPADGAVASVVPTTAAVERLASAIERLASMLEPPPGTASDRTTVREFSSLSDRFEAMLQRLEAGRARAAAGVEGLGPRPGGAVTPAADPPSA